MIPLWIIIAFVSGLLSNTSNFLHRFLLKDDQDPAMYTRFLEVVRLAVALLILVFNFHLILNLKSILLLLALGIVEFISIFVYMKQHAFSQLSISTIISRTRLIWTTLFAFLFLGERLGFYSYLGILILFVGLAIGTSPHKIFIDKGMKFAYLSAILISVTNVLFKETTVFASAPVIVAAMSLETILLYPILMIKNPGKRIPEFFTQNLPNKAFAALANVAALFFLLWAISMGPVSMVNAIYQGTMVFAVLAGIFFLKEKQDVWKKLAGTAVALIGILILLYS